MKEAHEKLNNRKKGMIIPSLRLKGHEQMALDELMLQKVIHNLNINVIFRFYSWDGIWLSIGKNQIEIPKTWLKLNKEGKLNLVKRPTGGGAVLHNGGLTYSLAWATPPRKKKESYEQASKWIIKGFSDLKVSLDFGSSPANFIPKNCFSTATCADLVDSLGNKRVGSAQLWRSGKLLQHGELILNQQEEIWAHVFNQTVPKLKSVVKPRENMDIFFLKYLKYSWPEIDWEYYDLTSNDLYTIDSTSDKYCEISHSS